MHHSSQFQWCSTRFRYIFLSISRPAFWQDPSVQDYLVCSSIPTNHSCCLHSTAGEAISVLTLSSHSGPHTVLSNEVANHLLYFQSRYITFDVHNMVFPTLEKPISDCLSALLSTVFNSQEQPRACSCLAHAFSILSPLWPINIELSAQFQVSVRNSISFTKLVFCSLWNNLQFFNFRGTSFFCLYEN